MQRSSSPNISPQYQQEEDEEVDGFSPEQPFTLTVGYGSLKQRLNTKKEKDKDKRGGLPFLIQTPSCPAHSLLHTRAHTQRPFAGTVIFPSPESTLNTQQIGAAETCCMKSTNKSASRRCYCHSWSWLIRKAGLSVSLLWQQTQGMWSTIQKVAIYCQDKDGQQTDRTYGV